MRKIKAIGINTVRGTATPVFSFVVTLVGVNSLGKENWGMFLSISLWISLYAMLLNWGNKEYLLKKFSAMPSKIETLFYSNFYSRTILLCGALGAFYYFEPLIAVIAIFFLSATHVYSSLDSLVIFQLKFREQFLAETFAAVAIIIYLISANKFCLPCLLLVCSSVTVLKAIYILMVVGFFKKPPIASISSDELKLSFPFFMIGLSGWLNSKADLYIVSSCLSKARLSEYQLVITAFLMLQAISAFIVVPLNKHLYRSNVKTTSRMTRLMMYLSIPIVILGSFAIWIVLEKIVRIGVATPIYLLAAVSTFPSYFYVIEIVGLYRRNKERKVMYANFAAAAVNFLLTILLIQKFELVAPMVGVAISQWVLFFILKAVSYENSAS